MNKQLSTLPGGAGVVNESSSQQVLGVPVKKSNSPDKDKNFPEFKRHEYDEGHLKKDLIYFNQINSNFTKTLGRDFINLLAYKKSSNLHPTLTNLIKVSLGDTQLTPEEYKQKTHETITYLQKEILDKTHTLKLVMEILRVGLSKEGISLLYVNNSHELKKTNTKKSWNQLQNEEIQKLSVLNLHLMATNYVTEYLIVEFKESEKYNFGSLSAQQTLRDELLQDLTSEINSILKKNVTSDNIHIIPARIVHEIHEGIDSTTQKSFKICLLLPEIDPENIPKIIYTLDIALKAKYLHIYETLERSHLLKTMQICDEDFNSWGDREYRETMPLMNTVLLGTLGGRPYYKPSNGWKRYAFDISSFDLKGDTWLKSDSTNTEGPNNEWANGYVNIFSYLMKNSNSLFNTKNPIYSLLNNAEDIGPNQYDFDEKQCGRGVIFSNKIENFLCKNGALSPVLRTSPVELMINGEIRWFLLILQCRVKPNKIRTPKNFDNVYFIVNDPNDIRPNGILMKEITKDEANAYFS